MSALRHKRSCPEGHSAPQRPRTYEARKAATNSLSALARYRRMNSTPQVIVMPADIKMAGVNEWKCWKTTPIRIGEPIPPTLPIKLTKPLANPTPLEPAISAGVDHIGPSIDITNAYPSDIAVTDAYKFETFTVTSRAAVPM